MKNSCDSPITAGEIETSPDFLKSLVRQPKGMFDIFQSGLTDGDIMAERAVIEADVIVVDAAGNAGIGSKCWMWTLDLEIDFKRFRKAGSFMRSCVNLSARKKPGLIYS